MFSRPCVELACKSGGDRLVFLVGDGVIYVVVESQGTLKRIDVLRSDDPLFFWLKTFVGTSRFRLLSLADPLAARELRDAISRLEGP